MIKRSLLLSLFLTASAVQAQDKAAGQPDLAKAKQTAEQVCGACHGADGNSQIPANPKLAGQHAEYLYKQLKNFKSEGGQPAERANPIMAGMAAMLSDDDAKGVAAYFAGQTLKPESAKNKASIELGQKLWRAGDLKRGIPACAACHGPAGAGLPAQFPRLSGQFADYTEAQLKAFRAGERANDPAKMMRTIALKMTDPEIKAVSDFAAGLR
ncbi:MULTISPECIES: c-type cytochrome [Zoogloea]|uniref:Cytochrome c4 n=1 Tax=Zoogloea oleivorans TaxID=1552750 RepID=A0A6C2CMS4_9RHOO|nr:MULTISPECIES: c-type cytochrome [Zoogloea]MBT9498958.1 cytochrome c4 [Zoogloea sp.]MDD2667260.1 c-type cytochrome [Zoogloea sp.]MDY0035619.1 c-type cytochrome [Zoogloea oleivorans]TYC54652.1 cytochrome c4 [Zoogloea oleivorans]